MTPTVNISDISRLMAKEPPRCIEAEMAVLGAMILDPKVIPEVLATLVPDDFWNDINQLVFRTMSGLYSQHRHLDLVLLTQALRMSHDLAQYGGLGYLEQLARETPGSVGVPVWCTQLTTAARKRRFIRAAFAGVYSVLNANPLTDTGEAMEAALEAVNLAGRESAQQSNIHLGQAEADVLAQIDKGVADVLPTRLQAFDNCFGGLPRSGVATILGHPASGKSTLAITLAHGLARGGSGVRIFSNEQPARRIAATSLAFGAGLPVHQYLNRGQKPGADESLALRLTQEADAKLDLELIEEPMDARQIYARCTQMKGNVRAVVVDYLTNLPSMPGSRTEVETIAESMRVLADIPRRMGMLLILVSQITASSAREDRPPKMSDGIGSSAIMQRSDMMLACWRPHQHEELHESPEDFGRARREWQDRQQVTQIICLKSKYSGRGMVNMRFDGATMRFIPDSMMGSEGYSLTKGA